MPKKQKPTKSKRKIPPTTTEIERQRKLIRAEMRRQQKKLDPRRK